MRILVLTWRDLAHPQAGGAEVYTEQVTRRWAAAGHDVTVFAATVPGRPNEELVDGYRVVRRGGRLTVYRAARRWYRENGIGQFDVVIDMVNTVPFLAHEWITDTPVVAFFHQTAEECWHFNAPLPVAMLGRYVLEPRWIRAYRGRRVMVVSQSTADALARFGVHDTVILPEGFEPVAVPDVAKEDAADGRVVRPPRPLQAARRTSSRPPASPASRSPTSRCGSWAADRCWTTCARTPPTASRSSAGSTRTTRSSGWPAPTCTSPPAPARAGVSW